MVPEVRVARMRLRKAEREALASLLEQGADTPGDLVDAFVSLLDDLRGKRSHHYACAIVAGFPLSIGPFSTKAQAEKAIAKFPAEKKWIVPGWTEEGWVAHLAEVDAKPEPAKPNAAEQRKRDSLFWQKARPLMDGDADGLVVKDRGPAVRLLKGAWG
jgi:hypothetical protein